MASPERLTLIGSLDELKKGDTFIDWPMHVAVLAPFEVPAFDRTVDGILREHICDYHCLMVEGKDFAYYGPHADVPVREVHSESLITLHNDVTEALEHSVAGLQWRSTYIKDAYSPHVTDQGARYFDEGDIAIIGALQLIARRKESKKGTKKKVLEVYELGIQREAAS